MLLWETMFTSVCKAGFLYYLKYHCLSLLKQQPLVIIPVEKLFFKQVDKELIKRQLELYFLDLFFVSQCCEKFTLKINNAGYVCFIYMSKKIFISSAVSFFHEPVSFKRQ